MIYSKLNYIPASNGFSNKLNSILFPFVQYDHLIYSNYFTNQGFPFESTKTAVFISCNKRPHFSNI